MQPIRDLEALLEPQERYDKLCATTRRRFGRRVIDLSYANPYDGPDQEVRRALGLALDEEKELGFQYTPFGGLTTTRRLIASKLTQESGLPFAFRDVIMTPGAMAGLNIVFRTLFGPADEVIVVTPCWLDYPLYLRNLGVPFRFVGRREDKHLDLAAISEALSWKTKGILFSHPCCPTGVLFSSQEIRELGELLGRAEAHLGTKIYVISDEVHRHLIWSGKEFYSPLQSYDRSLSIYSFGKALFLQGQRIGYVAVSPRMLEREELRQQLERCTRIMGFCTPTTLMQRAICRLLDHRPPLDALAARQAEIRSKLQACGYEVCQADATFFLYIRAPGADDFMFVEQLAGHGVLVVPSTLFHEPGSVRISMMARWDSVVAALPVFERVFAMA